MSSLSAHLREAGDHGRLAFHPECPICRDERLAGALPTDAIVSRRTQALFAAGVLAWSSATPVAVLAAEPDQEREGTAAPEQIAGIDPAANADFDPGGESTELPFDAGPPADTQAAPAPEEETEALEQEPATDEVAPVADAGDQASAQVPAEPSAPRPTESVAPQPTPEATPVAAPTPTPAEQAAKPTPSVADADSHIRALAPVQPRREERQESAGAPAPPVRTAPAPQPAPAVPASEPSETTTVYVAQVPAAPAPAANSKVSTARPGDRFHVVVAGESLWSISKDVLGADASVAQVARHVNRLWELNSERIGTGDPDLLMVGTRLALR